ncbi:MULTISPECIES: hypothetical protein [unclassified Micromonospora]|uniref:hypothetical protein n=1 Tax=unclassified Micromonospora TaxID=2617518 RepID=UPI001C247E9B|nr:MULTISPECIES: hypothetical protein [unclassified Micromonospora]MBU8855867.1 hypothetical protein [Micromonospora sp. WMMB482]MDM4781470.1 hypothetical protein [Micromonospora sp. b486]
MRDEHRIDVPGHPFRTVGERHRRTTHHEDVGDDPATDKPLAQVSERALEFRAPHQNAV